MQKAMQEEENRFGGSKKDKTVKRIKEMAAPIFKGSYHEFRKDGVDILWMELALWYNMGGVPKAVEDGRLIDWIKSHNMFVDTHVTNREGRKVRLPWTPENVLAVILTSQLEWFKLDDRHSKKWKYREAQVLDREIYERTAATQLIKQKSISLQRSTGTPLNWNTPISYIFQVFSSYVEYLETALYADLHTNLLKVGYKDDLKIIASEEAAKDNRIKQLETKLQQCESTTGKKRVAPATGRSMSRPKRNVAKINYKKLRRYEE